MAISLEKKTPPKNPKPNNGGAGFDFGLTFYGALLAFRSAGPFPFTGPGYEPLARAIAFGTGNWIDDPTNVALAGLSTGEAGSGYIDEHTTKVFAVPAYPLMEAALTVAGIQGPLAASLTIVVTNAFVSALLVSGGYQGMSPLVAIGQDYSKVIYANPAGLISDLMDYFEASQITGPMAIRLANGLGGGIAALTLTAFGTGTVVGTPAPAPVPASGPSISRMS